MECNIHIFQWYIQQLFWSLSVIPVKIAGVEAKEIVSWNDSLVIRKKIKANIQHEKCTMLITELQDNREGYDQCNCEESNYKVCTAARKDNNIM